MTTTINASNSGGGGLVQTADASGVLALQTAGTTAATVDASQNVGIGTASPSTYANGFGPVLVTGASPNFATIQGRTDGPSGATNGVSFGGSYSTNPINGARITFNAEGGAGQRGSVSFWTKALDDNSTQPLERMRIDSSGRLLVNKTSNNGTSLVQMTSPASTDIILAQIGTNGGSAIAFLNSGGAAQVGNIVVNVASTAYNTSSDYRLKDTITPMTGALAKVALLKPVTYKWIVDGSDGEGFIAHELAEVCPHAVTGEKDAIEIYTDEDGNEQTKSKYQGIDTSFLVATLTAAIQEQQALITSLTARIAALEGTPA